MWQKIQEFIREVAEQPLIVVYHNPEDDLPAVDLRLPATVKLVPHKSVPKGVAWAVNNGPSGRIITEE